MLERMDHFTIVSDDLEVTQRFYVDLLGLHEGPRPDFPQPGHWFYIGDQAVLHVISVRCMPSPRRGVLDHMAFRAHGLAATLDRLDAAGIRYRIFRTPGTTRTWQVFFDDPNGVELELDFDPAEVAPSDWKTRSHPPH